MEELTVTGAGAAAFGAAAFFPNPLREKVMVGAWNAAAEVKRRDATASFILVVY